MNVIREDVVQIGFDINDTPFQALIASLNDLRGIQTTETESAIRELGQCTTITDDNMQDLISTARGITEIDTSEVSDGLNHVHNAAEDTDKTLTSMIKNAIGFKRVKFADEINKLKAIVKVPINKVLSGFKSLKGVKLSDIPHGLNVGLGETVRIAGKLLSGIKDIAKVGFKKTIQGLTEVTKAASIGVGKELVKVGKTAAKGLAIGTAVATTAVTGLGGAAINVGMDFEASMSQVAATMGMTADEASYSNDIYAKLAKTAKEMGATTKFSASESAEALNYLALAGYNADKACNALPTILQLAQAGGMDLAATSDMVTDSMSALGLTATQENLTQFGDQLAKTAQKSNTSVAQLGEAILTVGGTAKNLKGGTAEMNTLLGIIADNGVKGAEGGTALRNIMLSLQNPTDKAAKALKDLGVNVYDSQGKMRGMDAIFTDLNKSMGKMTKQQKSAALDQIFNKVDLKSVNALLVGTMTADDTLKQLQENLADTGFNISGMGTSVEKLFQGFDRTQEQSEFVANAINELGMSSEQAKMLFDGFSSIAEDGGTRFDELTGYIQDANGAMGDMAETMNDNLQGRVTEFKSAMESVGVAIFEAIGSNGLKDLVQEASGWITELTTATETGGLEGLFDVAGNVLAKVINKITSLAPTLMDAGIDLIDNLIQGIKDNKKEIAAGAADTLAVFIGGITDLIPKVLLTGGNLIVEFVQGMTKKLPDIIKNGAKNVQSFIQGIVSRLPMVIQTALTLIQTLVHGLIDNLPIIIQSGITLLVSLAKGIISMLPSLVSMGLQLVVALVMGLLQNLPQLIVMGINLLISLIQGIVAAIPMIIETVVQLIPVIITTLIENLPLIIDMGINLLLALIQGLLTAIPQLISAIPTIISAIVENLLNIDLWIDVGKQILTSIKDGLFGGIQKLFGFGKSAAKEVKAGANSEFEEPIEMSTELKTTLTAANTSDLTKNINDLQPVNLKLNTVPVLNTTNLNQDIQNKIPAVINTEVKPTLNTKDTNSLNKNMNTLQTPELKINTMPVIDTVQLNQLIQQVSKDNKTELSLSVDTDSFEFNMDYLSDISSATMYDINTFTNNGMLQVQDDFDTNLANMTSNYELGFQDITKTTESGMQSVKTTVEQTDLYSSGQNVMDGLINGIKSKKDALTSTTKEIAGSISGSLNRTLEIHSPSRVTMDTGKFVVLGAVKGMEQHVGLAEQESRYLGDIIAKGVEEENEYYTPSNTYSKNQSNVTNHYDANFNLTIQGNTDSKATERQVKKWMKECIKEYFESMGRKNPRMSEV